MYFSDEFIKSLPEEPFAALREIYNVFLNVWSDLPAHDEIKKRELAMELCGLLSVYSEASGVVVDLPSDATVKDWGLDTIYKFFRASRDKCAREASVNAFQQYRNFLLTKTGTIIHYEFSEGDLKNIQGLLNQLRDLISKSQELAEGHKHRLLRRLEKLQSELHKKVSDLDRFWGFFIDASIVVGLMGENAKPMVEVIQKIVRIVWPTQTRSYELPSDFPFKLLGQPDDDKSRTVNPDQFLHSKIFRTHGYFSCAGGWVLLEWAGTVVDRLDRVAEFGGRAGLRD